VVFLGCPDKSGQLIDEAMRECIGNNNYVYENGECGCPEGYLEIGPSVSDYSCLEKTEGTFLMTGQDCFCGTEVILELQTSTTNELRDFNLYYNGSDYLNFPTACKYTVLPDGDEILMDNTAFIPCQDGIEYNIHLSGKFNPERTRMEARVLFYEIVDQTFILRDSCQYLLTK
jgi:hypothetical protein